MTRGDESYESQPSIDGREIRRRFQIACATAHGIGGGMSANELMAYVEEHGLPSRAERERIVAERMAEEDGDNTTP